MITEVQLTALIERFEQNVARAKQHTAELQKRVGELEDENKGLVLTNRTLEKDLRAAEKKLTAPPPALTKPKELSKLVSDNLADTVASAQLKQKIDEYIREIERCIAYLSTLS